MSLRNWSFKRVINLGPEKECPCGLYKRNLLYQFIIMSLFHSYISLRLTVDFVGSGPTGHGGLGLGGLEVEAERLFRRPSGRLRRLRRRRRRGRHRGRRRVRLGLGQHAAAVQVHKVEEGRRAGRGCGGCDGGSGGRGGSRLHGSGLTGRQRQLPGGGGRDLVL